MSEELMSFDEAVVWMVSNPGGELFSPNNTMVSFFYSGLTFRSKGGNWTVQINIGEYKDFKFSKTPIKIENQVNGLGLKNDSELLQFDEVFNNAEDKIVKALKIYIELLKHPLVVKSESEKSQYVITSSCFSIFELSVEYYRSNNSKFDHLSPVFSSEEDAEKAISDIGKDELLFMFKKLKGL